MISPTRVSPSTLAPLAPDTWQVILQFLPLEDWTPLSRVAKHVNQYVLTALEMFYYQKWYRNPSSPPIDQPAIRSIVSQNESLRFYHSKQLQLQTQSITLSDNGQWITAVWPSDSTSMVKVFSSETLECIRTITTQRDLFSALCSSSGETVIAPVYNEHCVLVWDSTSSDVPTPRPISTNHANASFRPFFVAFSSDETKIVICSEEDRRTFNRNRPNIALFDLETGQCIYNFARRFLRPPQFLPGDTKIIGKRSASIVILDLETESETDLWDLYDRRDPRNSFLFPILSPDGQRFVSPVGCLSHSEIQVWNVKKQKPPAWAYFEEPGPLYVLKRGDRPTIRDARFSPNSTQVIGISSHSIEIWNLPTRRLVQTLQSNGEDFFTDARFSSDGNYLIAIESAYKIANQAVVRVWKRR